MLESVIVDNANALETQRSRFSRRGSLVEVERPPTGALRKFGDGVPAQVLSSSSDRSSKLPGSSQNSPRVSSKWD
ncbi:hypothetical protein AVEN_112989-1 [Araneus ventricosus]|uniref:Uncharacterized protein n=1 Tax=Araneus ventricosus TaxID=182803 RepID=A0A4Y2JQ41_ARAVE|nr:hypothetical protein AVEN_112989-1 [Araneus ventricosus]